MDVDAEFKEPSGRQARIEQDKFPAAPGARCLFAFKDFFRERWQGGEIALAASDWAIEVYERARPGYPLTPQAADRALGLEGDQ